MASRRGVTNASRTVMTSVHAAVADAGPTLRGSGEVDAPAVSGEPPVLVTTKLTPPQVRDQMVLRGGLLELLDSGADAGLTLVACPAGFGKTSLLASWHAARADRSPMGWLTLDKGDNDPVVLWSYLLEALRRSSPTIGESVPRAAVGAPLVIEMLMPRLVNALAGQARLTLILDDFHELTEGRARESINWLVSHAPTSLQLVVSTRKEPELPLAALRAHGDLLELRAEDLRFTVDEADQFLNGRQMLGLTDDDIGLLVERTQGWPAGLYLAALSLRRSKDRHRSVARFGASNRHVIDYLETEVLAAHDEADVELMVRCSVLDRLSGPLCDAVLDRQHSDEALRRLTRSNLFVVPLEDDGAWYRFHPLFAQLMRVELGRLDPGVAVGLKRRAYSWHREQRNTVEAIGYAIDAGMFAEASDMIAASWIHWINAGRYSTVLAWIGRFPDAELNGDVRLLLAQAWAQSLSRSRAEAAATIARIEPLVGDDAGPLPDGFSSAAASLATLQGIFSWGDFDLGYAQAVRATELEGPGSAWRPVVCWAMGLNLLFRGELAGADRWFVEATELAPARGQWLVACAGLAYRSLIAGQSGRLKLQAQLAEEATAVERERGLEDVAAGPPLALGASLAARGQAVDARPVLDHAVALARFGGQPGVLTWALGSYATVLCGLGDHEQARAALAEARSLGGSGRLGRADRLCQDCATSGEAELTQRERTILSLLNSDLSESDIARELFVSHSTVHSHAKSIYRKLGASTRSEALARAHAIGIQ